MVDSDGAVPDSIPANERNEIGNNLANSVWVKSMLVRRDAKLTSTALVAVPVLLGERQNRPYREGEAPADPMPSSAGA